MAFRVRSHRGDCLAEEFAMTRRLIHRVVFAHYPLLLVCGHTVKTVAEDRRSVIAPYKAPIVYQYCGKSITGIDVDFTCFSS